MRQPRIVVLHAWHTVRRKMEDWGDAFSVWNGGNTPIIMTFLLSSVYMTGTVVVAVIVAEHHRGDAALAVNMTFTVSVVLIVALAVVAWIMAGRAK